MKVLTRIIEGLHRCRFSKPIVSKYVTFNSRDIIYQCKCGKRRCKTVIRTYEDKRDFPIDTTIMITEKEFDIILAGGDNWT